MKTPTTRTRQPVVSDMLTPHAERLYPQCPYLQREWMRAVRVVRATRRGWVLDCRVPRGGHAQ